MAKIVENNYDTSKNYTYAHFLNIIKPGEVIVISNDFTDPFNKNAERYYLCYSTQAEMARKYYKYEQLVKNKITDKILDDIDSKPENHVEMLFYVRAFYHTYPSLGLPTDYTVQFMSLYDCIREYDNCTTELRRVQSFASNLLYNSDEHSIHTDEYYVTTDDCMEKDIETFMNGNHKFFYDSAKDFVYNFVAPNRSEVSSAENTEYNEKEQEFVDEMSKKTNEILAELKTIMYKLISLGVEKDSRETDGITYKRQIELIGDILNKRNNG